MKLTVLGSGTCGQQMPGVKNRFPPAFVVEDSGEKILFDCSEGVRFRLEKAGFDYYDIHHVAISHSHPDHYAFVHYFQSLGCFNVFIEKRNEEVNLYAPRQLIADFPQLWKSYVPDDPQLKSAFWPKLKFHAMTKPDRVTQAIGSLKLTSFFVYHGHGRSDACAFRLESADRVFAYSGDCGICDGVREAARDADLFLCEASARVGDDEAPLKYGHLNPRVSAEIAKAAGAKRLLFFHYTGLDSDRAILKDARVSGFQGEISLARDFQVIEF